MRTIYRIDAVSITFGGYSQARVVSEEGIDFIDDKNLNKILVRSIDRLLVVSDDTSGLFSDVVLFWFSKESSGLYDVRFFYDREDTIIANSKDDILKEIM